jgi:hypothetical protein
MRVVRRSQYELRPISDLEPLHAYALTVTSQNGRKSSGVSEFLVPRRASGHIFSSIKVADMEERHFPRGMETRPRSSDSNAFKKKREAM